jgi:hypothetical protein
MNILIRILRWLGLKTVVIVMIVVVLTGTAFVINWIKSNRISESQVTALQQQVDDLKTKLTDQAAIANAKSNALEELRRREPHWFWKFIQHGKWAIEYQAVKTAYDMAIGQSERFRSSLRDKELSLQQARAQISTAYAGFIRAFYQTQRQILFVIILAIVGPTAWKIFWYYGLAPFANRSQPIRLNRDNRGDISNIAIGPNMKACQIQLIPKTKLIARMEWVQQYPPTAKKRTRFLWKWKAPLISCVAGLIEMTEWATTKSDDSDYLIIASGLDPDKFITRIDISDHPGISLRPNCVVAITDSVDVATQWNINSLHSWISGRLRHILFRGTGSIFITGYGGIRPVIPNIDYRVEEALVLGFEQQVEFGTARTETFWPYYKNKTSLFDYRFTGNRNVIAQHALPASMRASGNPFIRAVDAILNGAGKLIGF